MRFVPTSIPGVVVIEPDVHHDGRGFFLETYHEAKYRAGGIAGPFVQDNHSRSARGTLRGLHLQLRPLQGKLVRVVAGEVVDVAVDVRRGSPTFGRWTATTLSADTFRQVYVAPGLAHGFWVTSELADVEYKCTALYDRGTEISIAWNDPALGIDWPAGAPLLSARDRAAQPLAAVMDRLPEYRLTDL